MNKLATCIVTFIFFLTFLNHSRADEPIPEKDEGLLGEIRFSILTEEEFQSLYGKGWVLLKGQSIKDSDLHKKFTAWETLPDARGVFLRGKNNGKSNPQEINPDGDLPIGTFQQESLISHQHSTSYHATAFYQPAGPVNFAISIFQPGRKPHESTAHTTFTGGLETRPKNITVNIFIKIGNTKSDKKTDSILSTILAEIKTIPKKVFSDETLKTLFEAYITNVVDKRIQEKLTENEEK